jgi:hypothetical protein
MYSGKSDIRLWRDSSDLWNPQEGLSATFVISLCFNKHRVALIFNYLVFLGLNYSKTAFVEGSVSVPCASVPRSVKLGDALTEQQL